MYFYGETWGATSAKKQGQGDENCGGDGEGPETVVEGQHVGLTEYLLVNKSHDVFVIGKGGLMQLEPLEDLLVTDLKGRLIGSDSFHQEVLVELGPLRQ